MNLTTIWLIVLVVCIVVELITMGLTTIWCRRRPDRSHCSGIVASHMASDPSVPCRFTYFALSDKTCCGQILQQGQSEDECGKSGGTAGHRHQ